MERLYLGHSRGWRSDRFGSRCGSGRYWGGVPGKAVEKAVNGETGSEVEVVPDNGDLLTVVQSDAIDFKPGDDQGLAASKPRGLGAETLLPGINDFAY